MQRIAFVGRQPHLKTKSDQFFVDILKEVGEVTDIRREAHRNADCVRLIKDCSPDLIIFYQLPPSLWHHLLSLRHLRKVWVPMWDGFQPLSWKRRLAYRAAGLETVSFCDRLSSYFHSIALKTLSVRYYPQPVRDVSPVRAKPPYTLFLWQRDKAISLPFIAQLFPPGHVGKVILKSEIATASEGSFPFLVERLEGWLSQEELMRKIGQADYYIAPRRQEGIGFSFLEAMALGKVVIGYNDATMNEYISDGDNGHLFDHHGPLSRHWASPAELQARCVERSQQFYGRWQRDRNRLKAFLEGSLCV